MPNLLRLVTLNLWARHGDWRVRRSILKAGLADLRPDLVCFQETVVVDGYDQVIDLLGPDYHVAHQTVGLVGDGSHHGVSLASRWPLHSVHEVDLHLTTRTMEYSCGTLIAEVNAPEPFGPLLLVCHGPSWPWWAERERELQAVAAASAIEQLVWGREVHVLVGGDFNGDPRTAAVRFWTGHQSLHDRSVAYRDAWESVHGSSSGPTLDPANPLTARDDRFLDRGRRIDYALVRAVEHGPSLRISGCERIFDRAVEGGWASDHFGLMVDLEPLREDPTSR